MYSVYTGYILKVSFPTLSVLCVLLCLYPQVSWGGYWGYECGQHFWPPTAPNEHIAMNELIHCLYSCIVYINLVVTGIEAHNSRKASWGGGNLWIGLSLVVNSPPRLPRSAKGSSVLGLDWWVGVLWTEPVGLLVAEQLPMPKPAVGKGNKMVKTDPNLTTPGQF